MGISHTRVDFVKTNIKEYQVFVVVGRLVTVILHTFHVFCRFQKIFWSGVKSVKAKEDRAALEGFIIPTHTHTLVTRQLGIMVDCIKQMLMQQLF